MAANYSLACAAGHDDDAVTRARRASAREGLRGILLVCTQPERRAVQPGAF